MVKLLASHYSEKRIKKAIKESKQLREEKRKSAAAKWKAKKSVQKEETLWCVVQEEPRSQFSAEQKSLLAICHVTRSKFVFVASEEAISPLNVKLQLEVKHQIGPIT